MLYDEISRLLALSDVEPLAWQTYELREAGVPFELAVRIAGLSTMFSTFDIVEVAAETGLDVKPVARAHFLLGSRLELHWLRDQILALPRDDRWRALARAALREDLYSIHRELTAEVLTDGPQDADIDGRVDAWIAANPAAQRSLETLADIRVGRVFDLTTLPVAVREVRNLIQVPAPVPAADVPPPAA